MRYWVKETAVNRSLVSGWGGVLGEEKFYSPVIGSQFFSEPMPLDCELSCSFPSLLGGSAWLEWPEVDTSLPPS